MYIETQKFPKLQGNNFHLTFFTLIKKCGVEVRLEPTPIDSVF